MILGCPRPKLFFSGLPNLLPQKIRLPLISFFSGVNYISGSYIWGSSTGNGQWLEESSKHCPHRQTNTTVAFIHKIVQNYVIKADDIEFNTIVYKIRLLPKIILVSSNMTTMGTLLELQLSHNTYLLIITSFKLLKMQFCDIWLNKSFLHSKDRS
jgi:hypothetical protein